MDPQALAMGFHMPLNRPVVDIAVRRQMLVEDAFTHLSKLGPMLKARLSQELQGN